jgi:hypothetical protein
MVYGPVQECLDAQQVVQKLYEWDAKSNQQLAWELAPFSM